MSYKVYGDEKYKKYLAHQIRRQKMCEMNIECVPNGIIVNEHLHGFGVFDSNFKFVKSSSQVRENNGQFIPKFNHKNIPYIDADAVFVGNVMPQFGHFLLEHMNRAYAFLDPKFKNAKAVLIDNKSVSPVPEYMFRLLELVGVKRENIIILTQTTRFRNVYVPRQGYNLPVYSSAEFGATYQKIASNFKIPKSAPRKIYMSRCKLKSRKTYGEEAVQNVFQKNGFTIFYPETMTLDEQIKTVAGAEVLAGCAGSALHLSLMMKPGGTVIQLKRNRLNKDNASTQYLLNRTVNLNSIFICASCEKVKTGHGAEAPQVIGGGNKYLKEFFDDYGFKYTARDIAPDAGAMKEYDAALQEYIKSHGSRLSVLIRRKIVRFSACLIPGRENRNHWRHWLRAKLKLS